jgi:hypothetical protein
MFQLPKAVFVMSNFEFHENSAQRGLKAEISCLRWNSDASVCHSSYLPMLTLTEKSNAQVLRAI